MTHFDPLCLRLEGDVVHPEVDFEVSQGELEVGFHLGSKPRSGRQSKRLKPAKNQEENSEAVVLILRNQNG
jgi:hypothetical protein